jgi:hypothetical protein
MNIYGDKISKNKSQSTAKGREQKRSNAGASQFADNRPETIAQLKLQKMINNGTQAKPLRDCRQMVTLGKHPIQRAWNNKVTGETPRNFDEIAAIALADFTNPVCVFTKDKTKKAWVYVTIGPFRICVVGDVHPNKNDGS